MPEKPDLPCDWTIAGIDDLVTSPWCPLSRSHLFRAKRQGALKTIKVGRRTLVRRTDFDEWIEAGGPTGADQ